MPLESAALKRIERNWRFHEMEGIDVRRVM